MVGRSVPSKGERANPLQSPPGLPRGVELDSLIAVVDKSEPCKPHRLCSLGSFALRLQKVWRSIADRQTMLPAELGERLFGRSYDVALERWQLCRSR